ncbi:MAG: succinate dehydrogenase, cytochrome b556 subunit [Methylovulum sp.]|jgi:succinate dehydrogenase / fumarate reductase cytochrome b subunit|nr:succinate dehydrogenase, cytochrome b556 subunit [Methylovulum sp.]TSA39907.1 MAG: succinate dehydrogenase, cytochrome b556 subunit [Methylococcaceae bacterium]
MAFKTNRPTSPHLQIYKLPLTGLVSISHRLTGMLLSFGLILFVVTVSAVSMGLESYASMQNMLQCWVVKGIYWGFIFALFFHLCHGIRHLFWDIGIGFQQDTLHKIAIIEIAISFVLTVTTFLSL